MESATEFSPAAEAFEQDMNRIERAFEVVQRPEPGVLGKQDLLTRCRACRSVCVNGEYQTHKCPETKEEVLIREEREDYMAVLRGISEAADLQSMKAAIHRYEGLLRGLRHNVVRRASKTLTPPILHSLVKQEIEQLIANTKAMHDREVSINDELRAKGMSFAERMKTVNQRKMEWCAAEESRLNLMLRTFVVRPLAEWFTEVEYWTAKEVGLKWVIKINLESIIVYG